MFFKIKKFFYPIIMLISMLTIISALYIEYALNISPCKLCLYQRIPYILTLIVCFFGLFFNNKLILYSLIILFMSSILLSGYHLGIENNIFNEFSGCQNESVDTIDKSELLQNLNNYLPNCKNVNFRIFGLSLATINFIISIALTAFTIKYLFNEKNR